MDFNRIDAITGTIKVKGIGGEQSRHNPQQGHAKDEEEHEESQDHPELHDRVSIASLQPPAADAPSTVLTLKTSKPQDAAEEHPHIDCTV